MKFVKQLTSLVLLVLVVGCASQSKLPLAGQKVALKQTSQYLPKRSFDELGKELPYEAADNPYLSVRSKVNKGSVLLYIEAKKAKRSKNFKLAKQKLTVITKKDQTLSGPWVMLGDIAAEEKEYKQALSHYKKALEINSLNINAYTALAKAQRLMGEFNLAQNTLAYVLAMWPDFPEAHLNLGILYDLYLNQPNNAQMHMEAYLYLTGFKHKQALAWYEEVKSRTGYQASYITGDKSQALAATDVTNK